MNPPTDRKRARQISSEFHAAAVNSMLPSPPSTGSLQHSEAKRRRQAASSHTSSDDGVSIIQEQWRAGAPFLCVQPAITLHLAPNDYYNDEDAQQILMDAVSQALQRNSVQVELIHPPMRRRGLKQPPDDRPDRTVFIEAVRNDDDAWYLAIQDILQIFQHLDCEDMNVELFDHRESVFYVSPVRPGDRMVNDWTRLEPLVMGYLNDELMPVPWVTVDCVRWGYQVPVDGHVNPFTVAVTLHEDAISWNAIFVLTTIGSILENAGAGYVDVRVLRGGFFLATANPDMYRTQAVMGAPISLKEQSKGQGTLGGYLMMVNTNDNEKKVVGVTCHHVIEPKSHPRLDTITREGFQLMDDFRLSVLCPSASAHKATLSTLGDRIDQMNLIINAGKKGPLLDSARTIRRDCTIDKNDKDIFWTSLGQLGTVWCSSGNGYRGSKKNSRMDWALIDIAADRQGGKNQIPGWRDMKGEFKDKWFPDPNHPYIPDIQLLHPGDHVFMMGATTSKSSGVHNSIKSHFRFSPSNDPVDMKYSTEYLVDMVVPSEESLLGMFAQEGDSGSFIMNSGGNLVGILWAGNSQSRLSYIMKASQVVRDINDMVKPDWKVGSIADV